MHELQPAQPFQIRPANRSNAEHFPPNAKSDAESLQIRVDQRSRSNKQLDLKARHPSP